MDLIRRTARLILAAKLTLLLAASSAWASDEDGEILVATASNFRDAMTELAQEFERTSAHRVVTTYGSTGKHYAQILNGAPFDVFFAADARRPLLLEQSGHALPGSRFTYAIGQLVLWSPGIRAPGGGSNILKQGNFRHLAMANPDLAPYGTAAREVLESLNLWQPLGPRLVLGENVSQAFLFVRSGNAELGFVAWSQLVGTGLAVEGSYWRVPENLYQPIEQQAVLLRNSAAARSFLSFIAGAKAARIIRSHGYTTPTSGLP